MSPVTSPSVTFPCATPQILSAPTLDDRRLNSGQATAFAAPPTVSQGTTGRHMSRSTATPSHEAPMKTVCARHGSRWSISPPRTCPVDRPLGLSSPCGQAADLQPAIHGLGSASPASPSWASRRAPPVPSSLTRASAAGRARGPPPPWHVRDAVLGRVGPAPRRRRSRRWSRSRPTGAQADRGRGCRFGGGGYWCAGIGHG